MQLLSASGGGGGGTVWAYEVHHQARSSHCLGENMRSLTPAVEVVAFAKRVKVFMRWGVNRRKMGKCCSMTERLKVFLWVGMGMGMGWYGYEFLSLCGCA